MFRRDTRPLLTARLYKVWSWWGPALMLYYSLPLLECWNEVTTVKPRAQLPEVGTMIWLIDMHCNDLDLNYLVDVSLIEILLHLGPSNQLRFFEPTREHVGCYRIAVKICNICVHLFCDDRALSNINNNENGQYLPVIRKCKNEKKQRNLRC